MAIAITNNIIALVEFDAETGFRAMVSQADVDEGIVILDKLHTYFSDSLD